MKVDSSRYAVVVIALATIAAGVVFAQAMRGTEADGCRDPSLVFETERIGGAQRIEWKVPTGRVDAGIEGRIDAGTERPLRVRVLRTYAPSDYAAGPKSVGIDSVLYVFPDEERRVEVGDTVLPVHWMLDRTPSYARFEAYVQAWRGRPTNHPLLASLLDGVDQLIHGTRPHYVFIVFGVGRPDELPQLERAAERWLADAWVQVDEACFRTGD